MMFGALPDSIKWIGFDLDDTLHFFKKASGQASQDVFFYIETSFGVPAASLKEAYKSILSEAQSSFFSKNKPSREYRKERFSKLFKIFSIVSPEHLEAALDCYDNALARHLELKAGALEALTAAKKAGLSVIVVTEGPRDAQVTTISRLGIEPYIDILLTSAEAQVSKGEGLFEHALQKIQCLPSDIIYIGDSLQRDIIPADKLGIQTYYVGDEETGSFKTIKLPSLIELKYLIERSYDGT
jgi:putative hydrolase of the HAD superfamily